MSVLPLQFDFWIYKVNKRRGLWVCAVRVFWRLRRHSAASAGPFLWAGTKKSAEGGVWGRVWGLGFATEFPPHPVHGIGRKEDAPVAGGMAEGSPVHTSLVLSDTQGPFPNWSVAGVGVGFVRPFTHGELIKTQAAGRGAELHSGRGRWNGFGGLQPWCESGRYDVGDRSPRAVHRVQSSPLRLKIGNA